MDLDQSVVNKELSLWAEAAADPNARVLMDAAALAFCNQTVPDPTARGHGSGHRGMGSMLR